MWVRPQFCLGLSSLFLLLWGVELRDGLGHDWGAGAAWGAGLKGHERAGQVHPMGDCGKPGFSVLRVSWPFPAHKVRAQGGCPSSAHKLEAGGVSGVGFLPPS